MWREHDGVRGRFLRTCGIRVLRFENKLVFEDLEWMLGVIKSNFGWSKTTTPHPSDAALLWKEGSLKIMTFELIGKNLPALFGALLVAILFIQSGLDKVFDWKGNLGWLTGHFSKTFLSKTVPMMLATITVMELATGFLSAVGIFYFLLASSAILIFYAAALGAASITALFFGQRVAKDYPGAAVLIPYFILLLLLMWLTNPFLKV